MRENDLLASLPDLFATGDPGVVGPGPDDCAHVTADGKRLAFSVDVFAEDSHFLADADPADVAAKTLLASVSDLAASACRARWALVGLCLKQGAGHNWAERFAAGLAATAREWGVAVVGGDTVSSPHATFVSVTVAGEPLPGGPVLRGGGKPGDILVVTGALGGSILGRHLQPRPRVREIAFLMDFCAASAASGQTIPYPTAAMDISDGLALDLSRLCRESGVGAEVEAALVPIADDAQTLAAQTGRAPLEHALSDGEDFELLLALPPETWRALDKRQTEREDEKNALPLARFTRVGRLTDGAGSLELVYPDGSRAPLDGKGYEHAW